MEFTLAIIPSIVLLIYIYKMDKKEKEPRKFLFKLFVAGIIVIIPAIIVEIILGVVVESITVVGSLPYAILDGFIVAAGTEEVFKYLFLKRKSWDSSYFDCMFDGIVYAVFVSLGFASLENIMYVFDEGIGIAIMRMFTSVPGHMCFAVFMGYYYSKARFAINRGDIRECKRFKRKALIVPILIHGLYDCLIMMESEVVGEDATAVAFLIWVVFVIALFIRSFILVAKASKNDEYIVRHVESWDCTCGVTCYGNYCAYCGTARDLCL